MNATLSADEERRSPHRALAKGEWCVWCRHCNFVGPKNAAIVGGSRCCECGEYGMLIAHHVPEQG